MFKATKVEKNKRNKPTYQSANKFVFMQNFKPLFIAVSWAIVIRTCKELKVYFAKSLEGKQMAAEKMQ